jgi:hypothetical protein
MCGPVGIDGFVVALEHAMASGSLGHVAIEGVDEDITVEGDEVVESSKAVAIAEERSELVPGSERGV